MQQAYKESMIKAIRDWQMYIYSIDYRKQQFLQQMD